MFLGLVATLLQPAPNVSHPIEDTYIDAQMPDSNFGRDGLLLTGANTAILVRFPSLGWLSPQERVSTASLTFTLAENTDIKLKSVGKVLSPWNEGTEMRLPVAHPPLPDPQYRGGVTWKTRRYGMNGQKWDKAGAAGEDDAMPVTGVTLEVSDRKATLSGLGAILDEIRQKPWQNNGLRLEFEGKGAFFSSEGVGPAPVLNLTLSPAEEKPTLTVLSLEPKPTGWVARVQNTGETVVTGVNASWRIRDEAKSTSETQQALAPGDTVDLAWDVNTSAEKASPDACPLTVQVQPGGAGGKGGSQASLSAAITGLPILIKLTDAAKAAIDAERGAEPLERYLQRLVLFVNQGVLAQSRTAYAPEGCRERLRLVGSGPAVEVTLDLNEEAKGALFATAANQILKQVSPYRDKWTTAPESAAMSADNFGNLPDSRDDSAWPSTLMLPMYPWGEPKPLQAPLPERGLLSRAEVAALNELAGKPLELRSSYVPKLPEAAILSVADNAGNPLGGVAIEVFQTNAGVLSTEVIAKGTATPGGKLFLPPRDGKGPFGELKPDGSNAWFYVRVTKDFMTESAWMPAWLLAVEASRGNVNAPSVELRLMMPSGALKLDEDLAQGKAVTDSTGRFPAELTAAVDSDAATTVSLKPGQTLDIDLGRDRLVGGIELETAGAPMEKVEISFAKTGQKLEAAELWLKESRGALRMRERGKKVGPVNSILYTSGAVRARYLRIKYVAGQEVAIAGVKVRSLQQG